MRQFYMFITIIFLIVIFSCNQTIKYDTQKISEVIQKVETAINNDNLSDFQAHSNALNFFNFNSVICKFGRQNNKEPFFLIKPFAYTQDGEYIEVEVFLNYKAEINFEAANINISKNLIQKIITLGLPDKAYFYFSAQENQYKLIQIKYPFRYKYMEFI